MRSIKNRYFSAISGFLLLSAIGACTKLCNSGYEGSKCNILTTSKFTGHWAAVDTPGNITYSDTINQGTVLGDITLSSSFAGHHFNHIINASVQNDAFTIPRQQPDSAGNYVQGMGNISSDHNTLTFTYQLISGPDTAPVIANFGGTWVRQN